MVDSTGELVEPGQRLPVRSFFEGFIFRFTRTFDTMILEATQAAHFCAAYCKSMCGSFTFMFKDGLSL